MNWKLLFVMVLTFFSALVGIPQYTNADDDLFKYDPSKRTSLKINLTSFHYDRSYSHNEFNYGIAVRHWFPEQKNGIEAGWFRNSQRRGSAYVAGLRHLHDFKHARMSLFYGVATGYGSTFSPAMGLVFNFGVLDVTVHYSVSAFGVKIPLK